jgi:ubiquinone/menaquinone biosynthesis C-methylase UbiE
LKGRKLRRPYTWRNSAVDGDVTRGHYDRLAATYDENWAYSPQFLTWMTGQILRRLRISPGDAAADIGCGTGLYTRGLAEHAASVVGVDASSAMLAQVPASDGVETVAASVEDVAAGRVRLPGAPFGAMLLKEVLHHVGGRAAVISGLAGLLAPGGRMLVVQLPSQISYPLFAEALEVFAAHQPDPGGIADLMGEAGLRAELTYELPAGLRDRAVPADGAQPLHVAAVVLQ